MFKGAAFLAAHPGVQLAFVATNSICQGEQVATIWPRVFEAGARISFAHQSFRWTNQARGNAGVTCVVVGLVGRDRRPKNLLFTADGRRTVSAISPYLTEGAGLVIHPRDFPLSGLPTMTVGARPTDGGFLILTPAEKDDLVRAEPEAARFIRGYVGGADLVNGRERYCLWIEDKDAEFAASLPRVAARLAGVRSMRERAGGQTQRLATRPHRFIGRPHKSTDAVIVPQVSSERRAYVPMDFVGPEKVAANTTFVVYDAEPWLLGLLHSRMHMAWVRAAAGRMKTDIRYTAGLVYNTFPAPDLSGDQRAGLTAGAVAVLTAREQYPGQTLAQLYDPDKMPPVLSSAHRELDEVVDALYGSKPFDSDAARLELLFEMYEAATQPVSADA